MPGEVTQALLLERGVCKSVPGKNETKEKFLARQTHLSLDSRRLRRVGPAAVLNCPLLQARSQISPSNAQLSCHRRPVRLRAGALPL